MILTSAGLLLTPAPSPTKPGIDVGKIAGGVGHALVTTATAHPWVGVMAVLAVAVSVTEFVRSLIHRGPRDAVRRFSARDRAAVFLRAGGRCEHFGLFGRCRATTQLEADHVHPHSRGGWTNVANGQALFRAHNRAKRARVPYSWQLKRLEKRRGAYFPPGVPGTVARHERHQLKRAA